MKVLITGAGGFIGSYLVEYFQKAGSRVIAAYRNHPPDIRRIAPDRVKLVQLDLSHSLENVGEVDVVVHAAAHTNLIPDSSAQDYIHSNIVGTQNLANYAKTFGITRFIYLSTISVHGDVSEPELTEESVLDKPGIYGFTKYIGESILQDYIQDFSTLCVRLPGVVGKGYFRSWVGRTLQKAVNNDTIEIYNPESNFNNVVHLEDLARFISYAIPVTIQSYDNVNLATDEPIQVREVVKTILSLTGSESTVLENSRVGDSFWIRQDKVKGIYNFQPDTTKETVSRYVSENLETLTQASQLGIPGLLSLP